MAVFLWIVLSVLMSLSGEVTADFDIQGGSGGEYEFVHHEQSKLLLTFHGGSCYFARVDLVFHDELMEEDAQLRLQNEIQSIIKDNNSPRKYNSSLDEVRTLFSDVLADYRCEKDNIFMIWLDYVACDFQWYQSLCGWHANHQRSLQWRLHKGATSTLLTGPDHDHTLGTQEGQYLYVDASEGREGNVAEVFSPALSLADCLCLRFWYNMHGADVGELIVYTARGVEHDGHHNTTLWRASGNQGNVWRLGQVTVPMPAPAPAPGSVPDPTGGSTPPSSPLPLPLRVYLRATRGRDTRGDIAIDDVSSMPGVCAPEMLNCSFEADEGLCLWMQGGAGATMNWLIHTGPTDTVGTGPDSAFHTVNGDNHSYLYVEGDDGGPGEVAELLSPSFFIHSPVCLRFWHHMKGSGVHYLAVLLRRHGSNSETLVWQRLGPQQHPATWTLAQVTLHPHPHPYHHPSSLHRVVLQAIRGMSPLSDIAIDHISATSGACGADSQPSSSVSRVG